MNSSMDRVARAYGAARLRFQTGGENPLGPIEDLIAEVRAEEREACAKVCDVLRSWPGKGVPASIEALNAAAACIRSRK